MPKKKDQCSLYYLGFFIKLLSCGMDHITDLLDASLDLDALYHQVEPRLSLLGGDPDADLDVPADQHTPTNEFLQTKKRKIVLSGTCEVCGALANVQHRYDCNPSRLFCSLKV